MPLPITCTNDGFITTALHLDQAAIGLTKREEIAKAAMQGLIASIGSSIPYSISSDEAIRLIRDLSYGFSDAMLEEGTSDETDN